MDNPLDFIHLFFPQILTDFEDGLSVSSVNTAIEPVERLRGFILKNCRTKMTIRNGARESQLYWKVAFKTFQFIFLKSRLS